jgi:nucleotide-binding universal stress UspA family protein
MYHNILLCYDGSAEGRNALREGADVAIAMKAQTHLLAILRSMEGVRVPEAVNPGLFEGEERRAREILDEGVQWLKEHGLEASGHIVFGSPRETIASCSRHLGVDLIVLGHRNQSRLARWWSDAEDAALLEIAPCSILAAVGHEPG